MFERRPTVEELKEEGKKIVEYQKNLTSFLEKVLKKANVWNNHSKIRSKLENVGTKNCLLHCEIAKNNFSKPLTIIINGDHKDAEQMGMLVMIGTQEHKSFSCKCKHIEDPKGTKFIKYITFSLGRQLMRYLIKQLREEKREMAA